MTASDLSSSEYNSYYANYIASAGEGELMDILNKGLDDFIAFISKIPENKLGHSYAEGKWTIAELLLHVIDAERVFQYRALRFARNDKTPLPGFDQDIYVPESGAANRSVKSIVEEFIAVRKSTIALFASFDGASLKRLGTASGSPMSVGALGFVICGHQAHHKKILLERYL